MIGGPEIATGDD